MVILQLSKSMVENMNYQTYLWVSHRNIKEYFNLVLDCVAKRKCSQDSNYFMLLKLFIFIV